jgi:hypothetical protein
MTRPGFSLIEIVIAFLLASTVTMALYQLLSQTQKAVSSIMRVIDLDTPLISFYTQLEKDITGMFAPRSSQEFFAQNKDNDSEQKKSQEKPTENSEKKSPEKPAQEHKEEGSKEKKIDNVFVLESKDTMFMCSFITTGAVQNFSVTGLDTMQPFVRRVAYILEPHPERSDIKRLLYRHESTNLAVVTLEKTDFKPTYVLLDSIKQLSIEITVYEYSKAEPGKAPKKPEPAIIERWNEQEIWQKYKTLIPAYITFRGTVTDATGKHDYPFEFMFTVPSYQEYKEPVKKSASAAHQAEKPKSAFNELAEFFAKKPSTAPEMHPPEKKA